MLTKQQKKHLRALAHNKGIVIWIGQNGLSENILTEVNIALDHHELIKVRIRTGDRNLRDNILDDICTQTGAELVQKTGNIIILFRRNIKAPSITLP